MAQFTKIARSEMPAVPRQAGQLGARMREYDGYVRSLKAEQAGKLVPAEGETARAIGLRLSRAARRNGISLDIRVTDDAVYFTLA